MPDKKPKQEKTKKYRWDELRRENWWKPYTWECSGIGMSVPYNKDLASQYKIKRRKLKALRVYGLKKNDHFLPMIACLQFQKFSFVFDRAVHKPGNMRLIDLKNHREIEKVTQLPYIKIFRKDDDDSSRYSPESFSEDKFPFGSDVNQLEKLVDQYSSATISKFLVRGNNTLAVGLLANGILVFFKEKFYLRMGHTVLGKKEITGIFGSKVSKNLPSLHVLCMRGGRYKK